jgi:hypothetical protein
MNIFEDYLTVGAAGPNESASTGRSMAPEFSR